MTDPQYRGTGLQSSSAIKVPVAAATTAAITLSGLQTIDGVALSADMRVLVKNQADASFNGIYRASSGEWPRDYDCAVTGQLKKGTHVWVTSGSTNGEKFFVQTADDPEIATDDQVWATSLSTQGLATLADFNNPTFTGDMEITNTDDDAAGGPYYRSRRLSDSPADNDVGGSFIWSFNNDARIEFNGAFLTAVLIDASQGTETVRLQWRTIVNGVESTRVNIQDAIAWHTATGGLKTTGSINMISYYAQGELVIDDTGGINFPVYAATSIAAIANAVNTTNKKDGKAVWDTTNNRLMIAGGSAANAVWYSAADPAVTVTPS